MHISSAHGNTIISTVHIYREHYLVGTTASSLLLADLHAELLSEIPWTYTGTEHFLFDIPKVRG